MIRPEERPCLFDTSAEGWLVRSRDPAVQRWMQSYLRHHCMYISAITVTERIRGYSALWRRAGVDNQARIEAARISYLKNMGVVLAIDAATGVVAGEVMALVPEPPTAPKRSHRLAESKQDRLARWRFDCLIAATALVAGMPLIHNNAADFETIRGAIERSPERFPRLGSLTLIRCGLLATGTFGG